MYAISGPYDVFIVVSIAPFNFCCGMAVAQHFESGSSMLVRFNQLQAAMDMVDPPDSSTNHMCPLRKQDLIVVTKLESNTASP